jgi:acyl carrier protein
MDRLAELVAEILDAEQPISDSTGADTEPNWDSLAQLEILITVEEIFGVKFSAEEIAGANSVARIRELLAERASA